MSNDKAVIYTVQCSVCVLLIVTLTLIPPDPAVEVALPPSCGRGGGSGRQIGGLGTAASKKTNK